MDTEIIERHSLFADVSREELPQVLELLQAEPRVYAKGAAVLERCRPMRKFGLVLQGAIQVETTDINAQRILMASVTPGESFGEALHWLGTVCQEDCIYIEAVQPDTEVLWLSAAALRRPQDALSLRLAGNFITGMARRQLQMNDRIQALSKRTLREKILTFLLQQSHAHGSSSFRIALDRASLADYLGCDRASLSRELSAMRSDGLIAYSRADFTVLAQHIIPRNDA